LWHENEIARGEFANVHFVCWRSTRRADSADAGFFQWEAGIRRVARVRHQIFGGQRMNDAREIHSAHRLFRELKKRLLWHCTSPKEYSEILTCGFIKPNTSPNGKYGILPSACQALDAVSLFDFKTQSEARVWESRDKWQQFIGCAKPLTVILAAC